MDDQHISAIVGNEREWGKYLIRKMEALGDEQKILREEVREMRIWARIWRGIGAAIVTVVAAWFSNRH